MIALDLRRFAGRRLQAHEADGAGLYPDRRSFARHPGSCTPWHDDQEYLSKQHYDGSWMQHAVSRVRRPS